MIKRELRAFAMDWWALGVLAYRLLVGTFHFQNEKVAQSSEKVSNRQQQPSLRVCLRRIQQGDLEELVLISQNVITLRISFEKE
jgi:hypothetical protein